MCGDRDGEDGCVDDTHVTEAVNLEVCVDDAALLAREHRARRAGMVLRPGVLLHPRLPLLVALHVRARLDLVANERLERVRRGDLAHELQALAEDDGVGGVREVLRVNNGIRERVCGGDVESAVGEGVLDAGLDGDDVRVVGPSAGELEEDLDLADFAWEDCVERGLVNRFVAPLDGVG